MAKATTEQLRWAAVWALAKADDLKRDTAQLAQDPNQVVLAQRAFLDARSVMHALEAIVLGEDPDTHESQGRLL